MTESEVAVVLLARLAQRFALPAPVLADAWAEAVAGPLDHEGGGIAVDLTFIWEQEKALVGAIPCPHDAPPLAQAGLIAMYWWARFLHLRSRPCPLSAEIQAGTAEFFHEVTTPLLPAPPLRATALRIFRNQRGEPAIGGYVVSGAGEYYAVWGPQHPPTTDIAVTRHATRLDATVQVMRFLADMETRFSTLVAAGTIDLTGVAGLQPLAEMCPQCGAILGPSGLCYSCAGQPAPQVVAIEEHLRLRAAARDDIGRALQAHGVAARTIEDSWEAARGAEASVAAFSVALGEAKKLLARLNLPETTLAVLRPSEILTCSRLHLLLGAGLVRLQNLERETYRALVAADYERAQRVAQEHDRLASLLAHPRLLQPLAQLALGKSGALGRPLAHLLAARAGAAKSSQLLAQYLKRDDPAARLSAVKALQWAAQVSAQAIPPLEEALCHDAETVRLAAAQALAVLSAAVQKIPAERLLQMGQSDSSSAVRLAAQAALAQSGTFLCPACGTVVAPGEEHGCCLASDEGMLAAVADRYEAALLGLRCDPVAAAIVSAVTRAGYVDLTTRPETAAHMLLSPALAAVTRLYALSGLAKITGPGTAALRPLLRVAQANRAALAALRLQAEGPAGDANLVESIPALAATFAARGHLQVAALLLPPYPAGWPWAADYPRLAGLLRAAAPCPACGAPGAGFGTHQCPAPEEVQLQGLGHVEMLLAQERFSHHPLAGPLLLAQYNTLAGTLQVPPHPLAPVLPAMSVDPTVASLLQGEGDGCRAAVSTLASAPSLHNQLALAALLAWPSFDEVLRDEVLQGLAAQELQFCAQCSRFYPRAWNHRCGRGAGGAVAEVIPGSWQQVDLELPKALGPLAAQPIGCALTHFLRQDPDLGHPGVAFSHVHALFAETAAALPPVALIARTEEGKWFAVFGPEQGQLVVEEHSDQQSAYLAAQGFLRRQVEATPLRGDELTLPEPSTGNGKTA